MEKFGINTVDKVDRLTKRIDNFETPKHANQFEKDTESMKDYIFNEYMKQHLVEDFFDELNEYLDEAQVDAMRGVLASLGEDDKKIISVLSLPKELRVRTFEVFEKEINEGRDASEVMKSYIEKVSKYNFGIGFHTSPVDIAPNENMENQWVIKGTEADHRDDDRMMAYYSTQYRHLFKKRNPNFIYIVRTDPSYHKTDGNWSRADSLSVIMRVPFEEVYQSVEKDAKEISLQNILEAA